MAVGMPEKILELMKRGVFYPGHHLGKREDLEQLVSSGYLERMDASFLCGPDSEPAYCLTSEGCLLKRRWAGKTPTGGARNAKR